MKEYEGKQIYVKLFSDRIYTGKVVEISYIGRNEMGGDIWIITIKDKFGAYVSFKNSEIKFMEEEK